MKKQLSRWNDFSLASKLFIMAILLGGQGCATWNVLWNTEKYYLYKPTMSERALNQGVAEEFFMNCTEVLKKNNPLYSTTQQAEQCRKITTRTFSEPSATPLISSDPNGELFVTAKDEAGHDLRVPISIRNLRITDANIYEYADFIKEILLERDTVARRARLFSATVQVLTAAAGASLAGFGGSAQAIATLAGTSAVIPNLQMIFQAGERAAAYTQGVQLVSEAEGQYLKKISGVGNIDNRNITQHGAELHTKVIAALDVVEHAIQQTIPSIETLEKATGKYFLSLSSDSLTLAPNGNPVTIAVTAGGPAATAYSLDQNAATAELEAGGDKVKIAPGKGIAAKAATDVIVINAKGDQAKINVTVAPSAAPDGAIGFKPQEPEVEAAEGVTNSIAVDRPLDKDLTLSLNRDFLSITNKTDYTVTFKGFMDPVKVKASREDLSVDTKKEARLLIKAPILLTDFKEKKITQAPVTVFKTIKQKQILKDSKENILVQNYQLTLKSAAAQTLTLADSNTSFSFCRSDNEENIKVDCNDKSATITPRREGGSANITLVDDKLNYQTIVAKVVNRYLEMNVTSEGIEINAEGSKEVKVKTGGPLAGDGDSTDIGTAMSAKGQDGNSATITAPKDAKKGATAAITFKNKEGGEATVKVAVK